MPYNEKQRTTGQRPPSPPAPPPKSAMEVLVRAEWDAESKKMLDRLIATMERMIDSRKSK